MIITAPQSPIRKHIRHTDLGPGWASARPATFPFPLSESSDCPRISVPPPLPQHALACIFPWNVVAWDELYWLTPSSTRTCHSLRTLPYRLFATDRPSHNTVSFCPCSTVKCFPLPLPSPLVASRWIACVPYSHMSFFHIALTLPCFVLVRMQSCLSYMTIFLTPILLSLLVFDSAACFEVCHTLTPPVLFCRFRCRKLCLLQRLFSRTYTAFM